MTLKLYYDLFSQPSRALYIFLKTCQIPFTEKVLKLGNLEQHSPEYERIHRFKKVPAIEHNDFKLIESVAITRYICREFKVPDYWYPKESKAQAKVDEYLEWQHLNTRLHCASYFLVKVLNPMLSGRAPKPEKVTEFEKRMSDCLDLIENVWLKENPYLIGSEISVADIFGTCEIEQVRMAGYNPTKGRPRLAAWMERIAERTKPHYQDAHVPLNKFVERNQGKAAASNL